MVSISYRRWAPVAILLLCSVLAGCYGSNAPTQPAKNQGSTGSGKKTAPPALKAMDYFPLKTGSVWTYQGQGNEFAAFRREVIYVKNNFAEVKEDNGGTVSTSVFQSTDQTVTRVYFKGEDYSDTNILEGGFTANDSTVILKAPLEKGQTWKSDDKTNREIVNLDAEVDTPAGKFRSCIKIKMSGPDYVTYEYYKKGVGMVKREFTSGGETVSSSLESYHIP